MERARSGELAISRKLVGILEANSGLSLTRDDSAISFPKSSFVVPLDKSRFVSCR